MQRSILWRSDPDETERLARADALMPSLCTKSLDQIGFVGKVLPESYNEPKEIVRFFYTHREVLFPTQGVNAVDDQTLEALAEMICGDDRTVYPVYRSGSELTRFFKRVGFSNFEHDGSTRKWWTLDVLRTLTDNNLKAVILRLAHPGEYRGDVEQVNQAIEALNQHLMIEGLKIELDGVSPRLKEITPSFIQSEKEIDLRTLPPPDFLNLRLNPNLAAVLADRWSEAQKCVTAGAHVAAIIIMGSLLEGMLLAVFEQYPREANSCNAAPRDRNTGQVKRFHEWTLSDMINVSHEAGWLDLDVKKFAHSLREFRNLVHPYQQLVTNAFPDEDTCEISWLVVQAAANDLARKLV